MFDRGLGVLDQYGFTVKNVSRGRSALICETEDGLKLIREYWGSPRKLERLGKLQQHCREAGYPFIDQVLPDSEGEYIHQGEDGLPYIVKNWFQGRECDARSKEDILRGMAAMAQLHQVMQMEPEESEMQEDLVEECIRHNRELRRIQKFVSGKKKKNEFEEKLAAGIQPFVEQGEKVVEELAKSDYRRMREQYPQTVCHGDCNQHNLLFVKDGIAFTNFENWFYDMQTADIYQFMRKILEKHRWDKRLGNEMVSAYDQYRPLSAAELQNLRLRLAYPWKFWKLANHYAGSNKVWISRKNIEKLEQTIALWEPWQQFLGQFP